MKIKCYIQQLHFIDFIQVLHTKGYWVSGLSVSLCRVIIPIRSQARQSQFIYEMSSMVPL